MDTRIGTVEMNVTGGRLRNNRKRKVVVTDLVTGGLKGMKPDHFKFTDVLNKLGTGVIRATTKDKTKEAKKVSDLKAKTDKIAASGVGKAGNALANLAVAALAVAGGVKGGQAIAKGIKAGKQVKSVTPAISPIKPSVPGSTGDAAIEAAIQETQRNPGTSLPDALVKATDKMPKEQRDKIISKAQQIYDSGSQGVLSTAQKKLQELSTGILPKTKPVKDAEALLTMPQNSGTAQASTEILGLPTSVILPLVGVILLVLLFAMKKAG